jgi:hypothetical protein
MDQPLAVATKRLMDGHLVRRRQCANVTGARTHVSRESDDPSEATKARHEVMELVRGNSVLSHLVLRLRDSGMSWCQVKTSIDAEIDRQSGSPQPEGE